MVDTAGNPAADEVFELSLKSQAVKSSVRANGDRFSISPPNTGRAYGTTESMLETDTSECMAVGMEVIWLRVLARFTPEDDWLWDLPRAGSVKPGPGMTVGICRLWFWGIYVFVAMPFANKPDGMPKGDTV